MFKSFEKAINWLYERKPSMLCIDINSDSVKLLVLKKLRSTYHVVAYAIVPFSSDIQTDTEQTAIIAISTAIKSGLHQIKSKHKFASTCVNGSSVITKTLMIDANLSIEVREENILFSAKQYVPYPLDDINYDYEIQGINSQNSTLLDVLFVASRKENVSIKTQALLNAGITAKIIDVDIYAIKNACTLLPEYVERTQKNEVIGIINVGETNSLFLITQNDQILFSREQDFGGKQLTIALQEAYQCTYDNANNRKINITLPNNDPLNVLAGFFEELSDQIKRILQVFNLSNTGSSHVDSIFIAGENASLPNIQPTLTSNLRLPVYLCNPFIDMSIDEAINRNALNDVAPAFLIACGLAIRSFA